MDKENSMDKRVLYNHYGETFSMKVNHVSIDPKSLLRNQTTIFERNVRRNKEYRKQNKELFLRAKYNLAENFKRDYKSLKIERRNKIRVIKKSINELKKITTLEGAIKFEKNKIDKLVIANAKYLDSTYKWLKKTKDSKEDKNRNFTNILSTCKKTEKEYFKILQILEIIHDKYIAKISISEEKRVFIDNNKKSYNDIYSKVNEMIKIHNDKLSISEKNIKVDINEIEVNYKINKRNLILKNRSDISTMESEYNEEYFKNQKLSREKLNSYKEKLHNSKSDILNNIDGIKANQLIIKNSINTNVRKIKNTMFMKASFISRVSFMELLLGRTVLSKLSSSSFNKKIIHVRNVFNELIVKFDDNFDRRHSLKKDENIILKDIKKEYKNLRIEYSNIIKNIKKLSQEIKHALDGHVLKNSNSDGTKSLYSFHFGKFGKTEYRLIYYKREIAHNYVEIGRHLKEISYNGDFIINKNLAYIEFADNWLSELEKLNSERILGRISVLSHSKNDIVNSHSKFMLKKKSIIQKWEKTFVDLKERYSNKTMTKKAYKHKLKEYKIYKREEIVEEKLKDDYKKTKYISSSFKWRYRGLRKIWRKVYDSKIVENRRKTPINVFKGLRWITALFNLLLPGSSEIVFFKQYKKGTILVALSLIIYTLFVPFILGINSVKFGGILGIIDMGASKSDWFAGHQPDARYYLLGGIIAIFFLCFIVILNISSAITAFKTGKLMEQGVRPMGWVHTRRWMTNQGFPWMISLPGWFLILFIVITPVLTSFLISFTNMGFNHQPPGQPVDWVGFEQYGKWWLFKDSGMGKSIGRVLQWTLIWTLLSSSLVIGLGTLVAVIVNQNKVKFKKLWRMIYIIPWAIPAFVTIMFMKSSFQSSGDALMNQVLMRLQFINEPVDWMGKVWTVRIILILLQGWLGHSYIFLLVTGNMQSIPKDVYEASSIDGAKNNQMFRYMTMPILLSSIAPLLISQFSFNFNNFTIISLFSGGGPGYADPTPFLEGGTDILISWIYKLTTSAGNIEGNFAFSAAMTILAAVISVGIASYGFAKSAAFRRF